MNNTRFATAVHVLTMLADNEGDWLASDWIAGSININPVMVRKELAVLQEAGLVVSRKGKEGGSALGRPSAEISLADVYAAVKSNEVLGKKHQHTNPKCPIGKQINTELASVFSETDELVAGYLGQLTLAAFVERFR